MGTFRAWDQLASEQKWLRVHNLQEWPDFYKEENQADLRKFFDFFLKGIDNGWTDTPRVRYSIFYINKCGFHITKNTQKKPGKYAF